MVPALVWFSETLSLSANRDCIFTLKEKIAGTRTVDLSSDLVMPWPWKRSRVEDCICSIGAGRKAGPWLQDPANHRVELWLPFGVGWVHGGNHSIAVGVVQGRGEITTDSVYDLSPLFDWVECDGAQFLNKTNGHVLSNVEDIEFAAIFEIGRLLHQRGLSF